MLKINKIKLTGLTSTEPPGGVAFPEGFSEGFSEGCSDTSPEEFPEPSNTQSDEISATNIDDFWGSIVISCKTV